MPAKLAIAYALLVASSAACDSANGPSGQGGPPYALDGSVIDTSERRVEGATVEILDGRHAGETAMTDAGGRFKFPRQFMETPAMRVSKSELVLDSEAIQVSERESIIWALFRLAPVAALAIAGNYTMQVSAAPECAGLPDEARSRTFQVAIRPAFSQQLKLQGALFVEEFNTVPFELAEGRVRLGFPEGSVWERLDADGSVYFNGEAEGPFAGVRSELRFAGGYGFCGITGVGPHPRCDEHVGCVATHTVTLTRQ